MDKYKRIREAKKLSEDKGSKPINPNMGRRGGNFFIDSPNVAWQLAKNKVLEYHNQKSVIAKEKAINGRG
jgi:hypothetical protein